MNAKKAVERSQAVTYDEFKEFEGRTYTGMKVGGRHTWHYEKGEWKEEKVAPDRWEFTYAVSKRRAGQAPPGSGVPIGTEYHWYILAHQNVEKLDENTYSTAMTGLKFKVAHRRAGSNHWSAGHSAQKEYLIRILRETADLLEQQEISPGIGEVEFPARPNPPRRGAASPLRRRFRAITKGSGGTSP